MIFISKKQHQNNRIPANFSGGGEGACCSNVKDLSALFIFNQLKAKVHHFSRQLSIILDYFA
jgi:hypothetical protein